MEQCSCSSSLTLVESVGLVDVNVKRVDDSGSNSTRVLSDKSDVDNFSKNVFQDLDFDISCHDEL